jgi:hypothetical protein
MTQFRVLLAVASILTLCAAVYGLWESRGYDQWTSTTGVLDLALLQNASSPTVGGASDWGANIGRVRYRYQVGGQGYVGYRIMPLQSIYLPREAVTDLRLGNINIHYNPREPSASYIHASTPWVQIIMLITGAALLGFASLLLPSFMHYFLKAAHEST